MFLRTISIICLALLSLLLLGTGPGQVHGAPSSLVRKANLTELQKGCFLVASRAAGDPKFRQSVILMVHYDKRGAMGLIINHPTDLLISDAFPKLRVMKGKDGFIHIGGPVEMEKIFMLVQSQEEPEDALLIFDHVFLNADEDLLREMAGSLDRSRRFRVYSGYAGWATGQLEQEMNLGAWHVLKGDTETIFEKPSEEIWKELIERTGGPELRTKLVLPGYSLPRAICASAFAASCAF